MDISQIIQKEQLRSQQLEDEVEMLKNEVQKWKTRYFVIKHQYQKVKTSPNNENSSQILQESPQVKEALQEEDPHDIVLSDEAKQIVRAQSIIRGWLVRRRFHKLSFLLLHSPLCRNLRKRNDVIREIVKTEKNYVDILGALVNLLVVPLKTAEEYGYAVISKQEIFDCFSVVETIHSLAQSLHRSMESEMSLWPQTKIEQSFVHVIPLFSVYTEYVNNYDRSIQKIAELRQSNARFAEYIQNAEIHPRFKLQDLMSVLLEPIQRIPRYKLLLEQLLYYTPDFHESYEDLKKAITMMSSMTTEINESKRRTEELRKIVAVQMSIASLPRQLVGHPNIKYVREGELTRKSGLFWKRVYCFLLTDSLIVCKNKHMKIVFKDEIRIDSTTHFVLSHDETVLEAVKGGNTVACFRAANATERDSWLKSLGGSKTK